MESEAEAGVIREGQSCFRGERFCFICFKMKEREPKQSTPALVTGYLITAQITFR